MEGGKVRRITIRQYVEELQQMGIKKTIRTVRSWCIEGKIDAEKDRGGRDWIVIIRK